MHIDNVYLPKNGGVLIILKKFHFCFIKASILALCIPVGAFLIGLIMDRVGRKYACLLTCLPLLVSWVTAAITSSGSIYMFYVSRMFAGIGTGRMVKTEKYKDDKITIM